MRPHQLSTPLELFGEDFAQPLPSSFCSKCELFLFVGIAVRILFLTHEHLHREIRSPIEGRVQADQIDLAPEVHKQRGHDQLVVASDEPVCGNPPARWWTALPEWSGRMQAPRSWGFVHRLDLLHGAGRPGHIHAAAAAVLIAIRLTFI